MENKLTSIQYKAHAYTAKRLHDSLTIKCDNLHELVVVQLLGIRQKWCNPNSLYVYMNNYVKYLQDFNPEVDIPVFPMHVSFCKGVFAKSIKFNRSRPTDRKIVEFREFFALKPEFYYMNDDLYNI